MTGTNSQSLFGRALQCVSWLSELAVMISGVVMALMVAHVVLDVSLRYVIGVPLAGTTEIVSRYYMVTLIFLPIAFVQITDQHISASLISDMLSTRSRFLLDCLTSLLMAVFAMLLAWCAGPKHCAQPKSPNRSRHHPIFCRLGPRAGFRFWRYRWSLSSRS